MGKAPETTPAAEPAASSAKTPTVRWIVWVPGVIVFFLTFYVLFVGLLELDPYAALFPSIGTAVTVWTIVYGIAAIGSQSAHRLGEIDTKAETLQEEINEDFFTKLVQLNFKYIDKYYFQTQTQANKAFLMSAAAGFFGLAIITAGIVQMYRGELQPAYVTTAAGVVSEFIAAIFFYLYNKTVLRMADYHRKLVLTQNVGLALRITQDMPATERLQAQMQLVDRLSHDVNPLLCGNEPEA